MCVCVCMCTRACAHVHVFGCTYMFACMFIYFACVSACLCVSERVDADLSAFNVKYFVLEVNLACVMCAV